jgi:hypothetical protein
MSDFRKDLELLLASYSKESGSGTPDFILAEYLQTCLDAFDVAVRARSDFQELEPQNEALLPTVPLIPSTPSVHLTKDDFGDSEAYWEHQKSSKGRIRTSMFRALDWVAGKIEDRLNR